MSRKKARELLPVTSQVQEMPSVELHTFPALPTATNLLPVQTTFSRSLPEETVFHWMPSDEVRIVPEPPTVTKVLFNQATSANCRVVPEVRAVQVIPLGEVWIWPTSPTATNRLPDHAIERPPLLLKRLVRLAPSGAKCKLFRTN